MSLDFGVVLQTDPPAPRVIDLAKRAEAYGFSHAWTFDSHLLWEEPFVIYSRILNETHRLIVGPDGHQPGDARLDRHRVAVRDAQRDVRQPDGVRHRPRRLGGARDQRQAGPAGRAARGDRRHPRPGQRRGGRLQGHRRCAWPWNPRQPARGLGRRLRARRRSRWPARSATASSSSSPTRTITAWSIAAVRRAAEEAGRDPDAVKICIAAPAYVTDGSEAGLAHAPRAVPLVRRHGRQPRRRHRRPLRRRRRRGPDGADRLHRGPRGLRLQRARRAPATRTRTFVPDAIVDRFCLIGPPEEHVAPAAASCATSASTSSRSTSSTTPRTRRSRATASS